MGVSRRDVLRVGVVIGTAGISGCNALEQAIAGPDPRVVDTETNVDVSGALSGEVGVYVLVANQGRTGDVLVEVETVDVNGNTVDRYEKTVEIEGDNNRRVDFSISPADGAERFQATAEAA